MLTLHRMAYCCYRFIIFHTRLASESVSLGPTRSPQETFEAAGLVFFTVWSAFLILTDKTTVSTLTANLSTEQFQVVSNLCLKQLNSLLHQMNLGSRSM